MRQDMKIVNETPFMVEALPFYGPEGKAVLTIIVKGTFEIRPNEPASVADEQIPIAFGDELYDEKNGGSVKFEADVAPFKPRADIVVVGHAYAPGGNPVQASGVALKVGQIQKILRITGDRYWKLTGLKSVRMTRPQPFTKMPIVYERAFGGIDTNGGGFCRENLVGQGYFSKLSKKSLDGAPLPNIEEPNRLIKSPKDHPRPAGFGLYGRTWMPRMAYLGTYDEKWRKERSPQPPADFKFDYYNAAHPDLQVKGYLKGDEHVELYNLTSEGKIRFQLPGMSLSCSVIKSYLSKGADSVEEVEKSEMSEEEYEENFEAYGHPEEDDYVDEDDEEAPTVEDATLNLDTLCFIPDEKRFYQVWRGLCPISDLMAGEVKSVEIKVN
jgi:hypothetical protein